MEYTESIIPIGFGTGSGILDIVTLKVATRIFGLTSFASGKIVCTGATKEEDVYEAVENLNDLIYHS